MGLKFVELIQVQWNCKGLGLYKKVVHSCRWLLCIRVCVLKKSSAIEYLHVATGLIRPDEWSRDYNFNKIDK